MQRLHVEKRLRRISLRLSCTPGFPMLVKGSLSVARRLKTPIVRFKRREAATPKAALNRVIARCEASCCKNAVDTRCVDEKGSLAFLITAGSLTVVIRTTLYTSNC